MLRCSPVTNAQDVDKEVAAALKQATEAAAKMGVKMPDVKKQMADIEQEEAREEANKKAALEAQLKAPGPVALPAWMPNVPQFTPSGAAIKKNVDEQVEIVVTGTSPLTPAQLGDAWEVAKDRQIQSRSQ